MKRPTTPHSATTPRRSDAGDAELVAKIGAGDLAALGAMYDRYRETVRQFVVRATHGNADVDDILHDVFLALVRSATTYDGRPSAKPFLIGIAAQLIRARKQRGARWARILASLGQTWSEVVRRTPENAASDAQHIDALNEALAGLSEEKRIVLLMVEREGLSGEEVAEALGIPVATVWTRLHYARAELRAFVERRTR